MIIRAFHLFGEYLPPTQNWAYHLIRHLPKVENHIAARHYLKQNFYHPNFYFFDNYLDGVTRYDHSLSWEKFSSWLQKAWIKALPFWMGNEDYWLLRYIQEHKIDILHAHFAPTALFYKNLKKKTGLPFVVSFYGYDYGKALHDRPEFRKQYRALFQLADAFVCEGPHGAATLQKLGCPEEKVHIVPLGVETGKAPYYQREKQKNELKLIQVASFTEKKGHIYSVQAFAAALQECPNMSLTLVGDERQPGVKAKVLDFIKHRGLEPQVTVLDWIDHDSLHEFLRQFHVFIHPSCYSADRDSEGGAPVILLEAQATGMPIIATTHCDIPYVVTDGKSGKLSEEKEVEGISANIATFYTMSNEAYQQWADCARQLTKNKFEVSRLATELKTLYHTLM